MGEGEKGVGGTRAAGQPRSQRCQRRKLGQPLFFFFGFLLANKKGSFRMERKPLTVAT